MNKIKNLILFKEPHDNTFLLEDENYTNNTVQTKVYPDVSINIDTNLSYLKKLYNVSINEDIQIREFGVRIEKKVYRAFIFFIDGMCNSKFIDDNIITPLMILSNIDMVTQNTNIVDYVEKNLIAHNQIKKTNKISDVVSGVNIGECAIFINGAELAILADVKDWDTRSVDKPCSEMVIRGPQEGFTEKIRTNTALVRKIVDNENLIIESITIGEKSRTLCSICYIQDIVNDSIVDEVKRRLKGIKIDYLVASGELEQLIEDNPYLPFPQVLSTERPDRFSRFLTEGKVGVIVNGSPFALIMPITHDELIYSAEDNYIRFPSSNLLRVVRMLGIFAVLFLPGFYIAIINFHQEIIPTDLLIALEATRERIPFSALIELVFMEISFELIREASIRVPEPIGSTLGIVGGIILGQAAVSANIVSPILIIIVAITGIGSFAVPNFSIAFSFRILRFFYIFLGSIAGIVGVFIGIFVHIGILCNMVSFGVLYLSSSQNKTKCSLIDNFLRPPLWALGGKPKNLMTKCNDQNRDIVREWEKK
ncbi:MAG: spore germination protein [Clostridiales bacterium]|nr:spore germination protein [Clostridiales bacterium]